MKHNIDWYGNLLEKTLEIGDLIITGTTTENWTRFHQNLRMADLTKAPTNENQTIGYIMKIENGNIHIIFPELESSEFVYRMEEILRGFENGWYLVKKK